MVERALQRDPGGVHARVDFLSRDQCRQAVAEREGPSARAAHIGHHLVGKGRAAFEAELGWTPKLGKRLRRHRRTHADARGLARTRALVSALSPRTAGRRHGCGQPQQLPEYLVFQRFESPALL